LEERREKKIGWDSSHVALSTLWRGIIHMVISVLGWSFF
jgi:hypothetical protein